MTLPMAGEMPDIVVGHVETPTRESELGANVIAGEAMKAKNMVDLTPGFVADVLSRVEVSA